MLCIFLRGFAAEVTVGGMRTSTKRTWSQLQSCSYILALEKAWGTGIQACLGRRKVQVHGELVKGGLER